MHSFWSIHFANKPRKVMCWLQAKLSYPYSHVVSSNCELSVLNDEQMTTNTLLLQRSIHFIPWCSLLKKYDLTCGCGSPPKNLTSIYQKWPIFKRNPTFPNHPFRYPAVSFPGKTRPLDSRGVFQVATGPIGVFFRVGDFLEPKVIQ